MNINSMNYGIEKDNMTKIGGAGNFNYGISYPATTKPLPKWLTDAGCTFAVNVDRQVRSIANPNSPLQNTLTDVQLRERREPPEINLANNGINYSNWTVTGVGTTKGANGIHLVDATNTETAKLTVNGLEPSKTYRLRYTVSAKVGTPVLRQSNNLTGVDLSLPSNIGANEFVFTTRSNLTVKQLWFYLVGATSITFTIDSVTEVANYGKSTTPKLVLAFDDGWVSQYTRAFDYMKTKNVKGTLYMIGNATGTTNFVTKPMLDEMHANGWCIANHTLDHDYMNLSTYAEAKEIIKEGMDWLSANGYSRGVKHMAYPGGQYNADVLKAYFDLGGLTARTITIGNGSNKTIIPSLFEVNTQTLGGGATTLAQAKTLITNAITTGSTELFMFHRLVDTAGEVGLDGMNFLTTEFQELIDYAVASGIEIMTIDEWYNSLEIINPYWTGNNVLLQGFAGTEASGYVQIALPNGKTPYFLKFDGTDDLGILSNTADVDILGNENFAFPKVFLTAATLTNSWLESKAGALESNTQFGVKLKSDGNLELWLNGTPITIATGLVINTLYKVLIVREAGVLTCKVNGVQTYSQPNSVSIITQPNMRIGAISSNAGGTTHTAFTNVFLGVQSIFKGSLCTLLSVERAFNKLISNY